MKTLAITLVLFFVAASDIGRAEAERSRSVKSMLDTLARMCEAVAEQPAAVSAAQRFGMHLSDDGPNMSVTFSPRDTHFIKGVGIRRWGTPRLSGIDVDVEPSVTLTLGHSRVHRNVPPAETGARLLDCR